MAPPMGPGAAAAAAAAQTNQGQVPGIFYHVGGWMESTAPDRTRHYVPVLGDTVQCLVH